MVPLVSWVEGEGPPPPANSRTKTQESKIQRFIWHQISLFPNLGSVCSVDFPSCLCFSFPSVCGIRVPISHLSSILPPSSPFSVVIIISDGPSPDSRKPFAPTNQLPEINHFSTVSPPPSLLVGRWFVVYKGKDKNRVLFYLHPPSIEGRRKRRRRK